MWVYQEPEIQPIEKGPITPPPSLPPVPEQEPLPAIVQSTPETTAPHIPETEVLSRTAPASHRERSAPHQGCVLLAGSYLSGAFTAGILQALLEQQPAVTPTPEKSKGEPIDDEGNAYTRDLLYDKATNKQFITVQTKNGNTFFIVIDYDAPINEDEEQYQTYFLNMVDESDLLALLDEDTAAALTTCNCKEKCAAGQVNTDCPVCKNNMSECTGTAPVTPEPDKDAETDVPAPKPEKKSNIGMILVIFALAGAAGAAYYYIKFVKGRKLKDEDMDFFDDEGYEEEPYINEDDEPQIAEDAETDGDED